MAEVNTQPVLITASGLLSAQTGPNGVTFPVKTAPSGSNFSVLPKQIRIQGVKVIKTGASGSVEIFDSAAANAAPLDSVYEADANEISTNLGINIKSGDVYIKITGGFKVWLYLDLNS